MLLICLAGGTAAGDALWESPTWSLAAAAEGTVTYDSNVVARADNIEATYLTASPELKLARRASLTKLEMTGRLDSTTFLSGPMRDSLDPSLRLVLGYPWDADESLEREVLMGWSRRDVTDTDLGRRVRMEELVLDGRAMVYDSGRARITAGVAGESRDYRAPDLNTNERIDLAGDIGYAVTPDAHVGLGYTRGWGRSIGRSGRPDIRRSQDDVTVQARGRLLPKVTGTLYGGWATIEYSDGIQRSEQTWVGGAAVQWEMTALAQATVRARRFADFAPQGDTAIRTHLEIEVTRDIGVGWRLLLGGGASRLARASEIDRGHSTAYWTLLGVKHRLTERFAAEISHRFTQQYAAEPTLDYARHQLEGRINLMF